MRTFIMKTNSFYYVALSVLCTALFLVGLYGPHIPTASACIKPSLAKIWMNSDAKEKDLVRLKIDYNCGEKPIKSYDPLSASLWIVRGFLKCGRAECIWGRAKGTMINSNEMHVTFSSFSVVRDLKIFIESGLLRVEVQNNFRDTRRKPTQQSFYLHPQQ
jgi:hypothetical protein